MHRRRLLLGAAAGLAATATGGLLVENEILPGKSLLNEGLGRCDSPQGPVPKSQRGLTVEGTFRSAHRQRDVRYSVVYPDAHPGEPLPVCLMLHGYGSSERGVMDDNGFPEYLSTWTDAGGTPFALASVDGGSGYWHKHPGDDPQSMLFEEFLPLLAQRELKTQQVAIAGWSMGGYGGLLCGLRYPDRITAIAAASPAIFHSYADAKRFNAGAFSSSQDWADDDVTARARDLTGIRLRIDIGESDPFAEAVAKFQASLADPSTVHFARGCHDSRFWTYAAPAQIAMLGDSLKDS